MPTIMDVASVAGVSMKTVSRVLNNEAHVRPALKQKVEQAVAELGYRPSLAARQLAGSRSFIIAYLFKNAGSAYVTDVMMGAVETCRAKGYHLVSEPVGQGSGAVPIIEGLIKTLRPDGIMLTSPLSDQPEVIDLIARHKVPLVRIGGAEHSYGKGIVVDYLNVSKDMVAHLIAMGHRRIGFIRPPPEHLLAQTRFYGYLTGLALAGIAPDDALIQPGQFDVQSGSAAAEALLDLAVPPTAIFAANDDMALGALRVAHRRNIAVPQDLAIAGFDDSPASRLSWPELTTVKQPAAELGARAVRLLLGEEGEDLDAALQHELILRGSTKPD